MNARHTRPSKNITRSRQLRTNATPPERHLLALLRKLGKQGFHFRRQVPIGRYFADFACHHPKLIIELDGNTHVGSEAEAYDAARDGFLNAAGYRVVRFTNSEIVTSPEGVWAVLVETLDALTPTPIPSPQGEGEPDCISAPRGNAALPPPSPLRGGVGGGGYDLDHKSGPRR